MKKNIIKNTLLAVAILTIPVFALSGCASKSSASSSNGTPKTKIVIATAGMPKPFTYVDDKNELVGYDIEVAKAVFAQLPQYEVSFQKTEFPSVLAGLDSDRYQVGANDFAMNEKRKEKYIYTDAIFKNQYVLAVASNRNDINSFKDLEGKSTEVTAGVNYTTTLENYNKAHSDKTVKLKYTEADMLPTLQNVESGKYDFNLIDAAMLQTYIKQFNLKIKAVPLSDADSNLIGVPYSYFLVSKGANGTQLAKNINGALAKVIKDGEVGKISVKYFGADFSPK